MALVPTLPPNLPEVLVDVRTKVFAVCTAEDELALSTWHSALLAHDIWSRHNGLAEPMPYPANGASGDAYLVYDSVGGLYRADGRIVDLLPDLEGRRKTVWSQTC